VLLMLSVAWAQQAPSIEDMLADGTSHSRGSEDNHFHSSDLSPSSSAPRQHRDSIGTQLGSGGGGGGAGIGALLGAMSGAAGGQSAGGRRRSPDMFGRKPTGPANPADLIGGMLGGGGGGGLFGGGGAGHGPHGPTKKPNPIMDALLDSVESRMPINQKMARHNGAQAPISAESRDIVSGIIEAFMHKVQLTRGEKHCLETNLATLTEDIVGTTEDLVKGIKALMAGQTKDHHWKSQQTKVASESTLATTGMDGAMKLTSLITMSTTLMKNCVEGDALDMMKTVGRHFINMKYISHRLLVSGVDIAHRMSDSIISFEDGHFHRLGMDIGTVLRKVLLSNSERGSHLPEGVPEEAIIQETSEGLFRGFFTRGSGMEITDSAAPDVDIQLDLHRCIAGNHEFFKEVWLAMWNLVAELAVSAGHHDWKTFENPFGDDSGEQPKWMGELMVAMMQVPMALSRCNIDKDMQQMLMQAIKSIQYLKVHFIFPHHIITTEEATKRMALAVSAWTNWDFKKFGREIGTLLQEFVILMYPQEYSVDSSGRLRRQLGGKSKSVKVSWLATNTSVAAFVASASIAAALVGLVAMRGFRSFRHSEDESSTRCEGHIYDAELVNNFIEVEIE